MPIQDTKEWKQAIRMRPAQNRVLSEVFGVNECNILRYEQEGGPHILDSEFAIDLKLILPCGAQLSGQEKALSHQFYKFRTFTIEFYQNRYHQEPGEFFKIASQFYLSGYSNSSGDDFIEWHIVKMFDFINWIRCCKTEELARRCKPAGGSRASFLPVPYDKIPRDFIYASGGGPGETHVYGNIRNLIKKPEAATSGSGMVNPYQGINQPSHATA